MEFLSAPDYWLARFLIQRALGAIYLVAFLVAANQFRGLCGERGILPVRGVLQRFDWKSLPSLFWLSPKDRTFTIAAWAGVVLSLVAVSGLSDAFGFGVSLVTWFLLWALYLSFVSFGQLFYAYGWESLLLELGFLSIFLAPSSVEPTWVTIWLVRWILFRVMFGAGLIKIRGDRCWRELTCLDYHYETQPLPNVLSFLMHRSPAWFHKLEVVCTHLVQLVVIWGIFLPQPWAAVAGGVVILFQATLILSGNLSWLNYLTAILAVACFSDGTLAFLEPLRPASLAERPLWFDGLVLAVAVLVLALSYRPARNLFSRNQRMNATFDRFHLVNTYGAFGSVTKERREIELQGTRDEDPTEDAKWKTYRFKGKPGDPRRRPPWVAPYHLRLDWQMWFAAMSPVEYQPWFQLFAIRLMRGVSQVRKLLADDPFEDDPPVWIRAIWYRYRFATFAEWRESGRWWVRERLGEYMPPVRARDQRE